MESIHRTPGTVSTVPRRLLPVCSLVRACKSGDYGRDISVTKGRGGFPVARRVRFFLFLAGRTRTIFFKSKFYKTTCFMVQVIENHIYFDT